VFGKSEEKGWKYIPVFEILSLEKRTLIPKLEKEYNIIGLENIERDSGKLVDFKPSLGKQSTSNKVTFEKGMILYRKLRPYLNKVWVAEFNGIATTEILPFKANPKKTHQHYVAYYFRSGEFLNKVNENCSGARMPRLTTNFWDETKIPLPDLPIQQRIVNYLNQLSAKQQQLQQHYSKQLQQLQALKASLLDTAFRGELA
jgi:type I restriction enzyme S subunit